MVPFIFKPFSHVSMLHSCQMEEIPGTGKKSQYRKENPVTGGKFLVKERNSTYSLKKIQNTGKKFLLHEGDS